LIIILLSYDLNGHERPDAYDDVKQMIVDNAISYKRPLYSQWFIETDDTVQTWHERMKEVTDDNDHWFIVKVARPRQGWFGEATWDWLNERT
jgi:hypothetical protein